jgi:hypothetical protein
MLLQCFQNGFLIHHLGIVRNGENTVDIEERLKSGRGTIYGLLGAG